MLSEVAGRYRTIITVEDGCTAGGLHGAVTEYVASRERPVSVRAIGIPDRFIGQGTQTELRSICGLSENGIYSAICDEMRKS